MAESDESAPFAVSMGDPAGIGPDITLAAWKARGALNLPPFFVTGHLSFFRRRPGTGPDFAPVVEIARPDEAHAAFRSALPILSVAAPGASVEPGIPEASAAPAIIAAIETAAAFAIEGRAAAVITNPIAKHVLMREGFAHAGHTEFLAELCTKAGGPRPFPVMLMASDRLFAVPVTVHIPLKQVSGALTAERLIQTAEIAAHGLRRYFGIARPRLAVCGLNPHAGEEGELGREEIEIIAPAIAELRSRGLDVLGPMPADSLFHETARQAYDVVLAMYHDQALIPFKMLSFKDGVNVTLGLPVIRTSPDHGTAFPLAGTGRANPASFIAALRLADRMARAAQSGRE